MGYDMFDPRVSAVDRVKSDLEASTGAKRLTLVSHLQTATEHVEQLQQIESRLWGLLEAIGGPQPPTGSATTAESDEVLCLGYVDRLHQRDGDARESIRNINQLINNIESVIR